jgi:Leucine-rich repeat (LRR) protein
MNVIELAEDKNINKQSHTTFVGFDTSNVSALSCKFNNIISLVGLSCPLLTTLNVSWNQITTLAGLSAPLLTRLDCSGNNLTSLEGLNAPLLKYLTCSHTVITSLEGLNAPLLKCLTCSHAVITSLVGLNAPHLTYFDCSNNQITSLEGLVAPILTTLDCSNNRITSLAGLNAPLLTILDYYGNPIEYIPPYITRLLNRAKNNQQVYSDGQNVHNHNIQECIRQSIQRILCKKPTVVDIYETLCSDEILTVGTKEILIQYMNNPEVHSTLNITFKELLEHVWSRIMSNEHASEIKVILNEEMKDSLCKCFTGCLSRLINCLNGMDELVSIKISDTEQIGNIIGLIKEKLENKKEYTIEIHREEVRVELEERGYSEEVIVEWISYIE